MIGSQLTPYWVSGTDAATAHLAHRKEYYFRVRMPWRTTMYDIFSDELVKCRPQFCVIWYKPARAALVVRFGWAPGIERN